MSSSIPPPPPSRSSSCFVTKPARGFQVLRIDGYSCTKDLLGGERISSDIFIVGGRHWCVDYYPNGADASVNESGAIALYLRLAGTNSDGGGHRQKVRVPARYKFSLLDVATGDATYERPEETGVFTFDWHQAAGGDDARCGYAEFITRQELEGLIREDRLAIRCDVGVTEVAPLPVVAADPLAANPSSTSRFMHDIASRQRYNYLGFNGYNGGIGDEFYGLDGYRRSQEPPLDDKEYILRCLTAERPRE
ncbi:unnamed protein product [Urochloa decumbens]|uniref:MATH domain-containing protein n=1 Tax=Urochloa decumbens TaxID=240449 RepID=A0ABC9BQF0_9POAL